MRIAVLHHPSTYEREARATLLAALEQLGHAVSALELGAPLAAVVARLEAERPDVLLDLTRRPSAFVAAVAFELGLRRVSGDALAFAFASDDARRTALDPFAGALARLVQSVAPETDATDRRPRERPPRAAARRAKGRRIGLTFNLKRVAATRDDAELHDEEAEYDSPKTIRALRDAIEAHGHEVVELEATPELPLLLPAARVDAVFNLAEGLRGRSREAQVPALCEMLEIPYTGSDPATLAITLDKALAKRIVGHAGVPTAEHVVLETGRERLPADFPYPAIVKPVAEGSSKGVAGGKSVVETERALRAAARACIERYRQPALVEAFLPGREFTIALLGWPEPQVLPPMEIVFLRADVRHPVYSFESKLDIRDELRYEVPARTSAKLGRELRDVALRSWNALGCRDVARVDVRLDATGRVRFIECNPLPGLAPGWSDLCAIADAAGIPYRELVGRILAGALARPG